MADTKPAAEPKAKADADVAEYELLADTIERSGHRYYRSRGDKVPLPRDEAEQLIRLGAVKG